MDLNSVYNRWGQMKQQLADQEAQRNAKTEASITPEDQTTYADNFRNKAINTLGMPENWQNTVADEKRYEAAPKPVEALNNPVLQMAVGGPQVRAGKMAVQGAEALAPGLKAIAQRMMSNPKGAIEVAGPMNMSSFQKLRDALGHVGPIIMKGGK